VLPLNASPVGTTFPKATISVMLPVQRNIKYAVMVPIVDDETILVCFERVLESLWARRSPALGDGQWNHAPMSTINRMTIRAVHPVDAHDVVFAEIGPNTGNQRIMQSNPESYIDYSCTNEVRVRVALRQSGSEEA
jgi:hypothetical protein